jgi:hypothetical protein
MKHAVVPAISLAVSVAYVALNSMFLYYLSSLNRETCACAFNWRRVYVATSLVVFLAMSVVNAVAASQTQPNGVLSVLSLALFPFVISYVIVTRQYVVGIQDASCECAETTPFRLLKVVNIIQIALLLLTAITLLATLVLFGMGAASKPPTRPQSVAPRSRR